MLWVQTQMPLGQVIMVCKHDKMLLMKIKMPVEQMRTFVKQLKVAEALKDLICLK